MKLCKPKRSVGVRIAVDENFYKKIEKERQKFMKKNNLVKLTTVAFTGVLANNIDKRLGVKRKNVKK